MIMSVSSKIKKFENLLANAQSDNERFAVLLLITKTIEIYKLSNDEKTSVFDAIGLEFPLRMIQTSVKKVDGNSLPLALLGVSVISSLNENLSVKNQVSVLQNVLEIMKKCIEGKFDNYSENELTLYKDSNLLWNEIFADLTKKEESNLDKYSLIYVKEVCVGCEVENSDCSNSSIHFLIESFNANVFNSCDSLIEPFQHLFSYLSVKIHMDKSEMKFNLMKSTSKLINSLPEVFGATYFLAESNKNFCQTLTDVLSSKLSVYHRHTALIFANSFISKAGFEFFVPNQNDRNCIRLIIRLSCIEAKIWLENNVDENVMQADNLSLIACWCNIIEEACSKILKFENDDDSFFDFEDIKSLQPVLEDVAKINGKLISMNISSSDVSQQDNTILQALIKLLCAWLCVEHHVYSEVGFELMPTLCRIINHVVKTNDFHLTKYTLSPLMLLIEDAASLTHLLQEEHLVQILHKLFIGLYDDIEVHFNDVESVMQCVYGIQSTVKSRAINITTTSREEFGLFYEAVSNLSLKLDASYWYVHLLQLLLHSFLNVVESDKELKNCVKKLKIEVKRLTYPRSDPETTVEVLICEQLEKLKLSKTKSN